MFALARKNVLWAAVVLTLPFSAAAGAETSLEQMEGWPYAGARAVAVDADRDLIYLGSGGVILVLDVADPAMPQLLHDGLHTDGHVRDLRYVGADKRLYVADWRGGLEIWDVQDPQNPVRLSTVPVYYVGTGSDQPTDGLVLAGSYLYVNANEARVHAFDISDPANPVDLGVQAGPLWYYTYERDTDDVAAEGGFVYVVGSGIAKYLIRADGTLDKVGENTYIDISCIEVQGSYAYAGDSQSLGVIDVSSSYPNTVGSVAVSEGLNDLALTGNFVVGVNRNGLLIFDVSTPQQPQQIASLLLPDGYRVRLDGDLAFVSSDAAGLQVIDISDVHNPVLIGNFDTVGTTSGVTVAGNYAFLGQSTEGLVITDVSDPSAVQLAGRSDDGGSVAESLLIGNYLYVSDWYAPALRVLDVSDLSNPVEVGSILDFTAVDLATDGEHLYATRFSVDTQLYYLHVFHLTDPASPAELSMIPVSHHVLEIQYANDHLFAIEFFDMGLHIINVADPNNPFEDAFYPVDWGEDVWIQGDYAYVTSFHQGLLVLNIGDPANPTLVGSFYEVFQFGDVAVSGSLAFITTGTTGEQHLRLYDVSDLDNIYELDRIRLPGDAWDLTAQGNYAYVADGFAGLQILRAGPDGMMFADGFESGDMSNWSATVD